MSLFRKVGLLALLLMSLTGRVDAHALNQSYIFLRVYDNEISGRFEVTVVDLNKSLDLGFPTDGTATTGDVDAHAEAVKQYLSERIRMWADGAPVNIRFGEHSLSTIPISQYVIVEFVLEGLSGQTRMLEVEYDVVFEADKDHRGFLVIEHNWKTATFNNEASISLIFTPSSGRQKLDLSSSSAFRGFLGLVELGIHHIWVGIDHILFLMALLLPSVLTRESGRWTVVGSFREALIRVIKVVTLFTIAHSVTLSLAALGVLSVPSRVVESIIAVSIAVAAVDILFPVFKGRVWIVVFAFGLFHGFGFASVLGEMGISSRFMALSLLGFNIGVEVGQAAIVCVAFPLLYLLRSRQIYVRYALPAAATILIVVSLYWFTERAFNVDLPAGALVNRLIGFFA